MISLHDLLDHLSCEGWTARARKATWASKWPRPQRCLGFRTELLLFRLPYLKLPNPALLWVLTRDPGLNFGRLR